MIINYLKTAFRFISRNKLFSIINILGLSVGMACSILIFLWVQDELSFDRFHDKADQIYRVIMEKESDGSKEKIARTSPPVGRALKDEFPEIIASTRFFFMDLEFIKDIETYEEDGAFVDQDLFKMFNVELIKGDTSRLFASNFNIAISEKLALKIFDSADVIGKDMRVGQTTTFTVQGVFKDLPHHSHLRFDFVVPYSALYDFGLPREMWDNYNNTHYTYVLLDKKAPVQEVNQKIKDLFKKHNASLKAELFLQPLDEVYLRSDFSGDYPRLGNYKNIYIFSIISFFIIIIASFNFMNLTTAQASSRIKEIGIRKVLGGQRKGLILQFLGEAVLMTFMAHIFAIIFVELVLPVFNNLTAKELELNYFNADFLLLIAVVIVFVGLFSGSYPALYLSKLNPLSIFKEGLSGNSGGGVLRRILVILQFALSIILIIAAVVIMKQMNFLNQKNLGFEKDNLLYFGLQDHGDRYEVLKERLLKYPEIKDVTVLSHELTDVVHLANVTWEGQSNDEEVPMNLMFVDHDFITTMGMELIKGKDFERMHEGDSIASYIINEAAASQLGFENPIGKRFSTGRLNGYIVGVVKNFNFQPLYNRIQPMVLTSYPDERFYLYARINAGDTESVVSTVKAEFKNFAPNSAFEYSFMDEEIEQMYRNENNLAKLTRYFTLITIFISTLGLFGLASFMAEKRRKEIGIRKVLGATVPRIAFLLSREILVWITISNVISWPLAYYLAQKWLHNFSYRIDLSIGIFLFSGVLALLIAMLTVNIRVVKAAYENPVKSLRYE
ncbi:MAG: ABC transporter permease [Bacteroidales bacterium]|jgi:ABC-type antimicrobial peptide transport system permease subunit|nr:ABC transporter permease [Bacteroidales bacterium]